MDIRSSAHTGHSNPRGPLLHSLEYDLRVLADSTDRSVGREAAYHNLRPLEFAIMRLFLPDTGLTVTELARTLSIQMPTVSRASKTLVNRGVLRRCRRMQDRRIVLLELTEGGVALCRELQERMNRYEEKIVEGINADDLEVCLSTIKRIVANQAVLEQSTSGNIGVDRERSAAEPTSRS